MRKLITTIIAFAFLANVSAQIEVNSSGNVGIGTTPSSLYKLNVTGGAHVAGDIYLGSSSSNFLGTTANNIPITFKQGTTLAGFTGGSTNSNVSFGYGSLRNPLTGGGVSNVAVGSYVLYSNTAGFNNTANGSHALYSNTTGSNNTANGCQALYSNTTGSANTVIGCYASASANNLYNATAIGYDALVSASEQVRIGNYYVNSIGGYVGWSNISDGRIKKNIRSEVPGLAFVKQLQPVMYNFDLEAMDELQKSDDPKINAQRDSIRNARSPKEKEIEAKSRANKEKIVYSGFIAQDVEKAAQSVDYDFSGVDAPQNGKGAYGLRYAEFVVPLVKAVQELSGQVEELQRKVEQLEGKATKNSLRSATEENMTTDISNTIVTQCKLYQNTPNPFNQDTQIGYYVPESVGEAQLCIYNLQGTQIKQTLITERGEGLQWISGSELAAGIYLYALIVDGKEVDTKRMILTK